jgi:hypothetical protein
MHAVFPLAQLGYGTGRYHRVSHGHDQAGAKYKEDAMRSAKQTKRQTDEEKLLSQTKVFVNVAVAWGLIGSSLVFFLQPEHGLAFNLRWYSGLWACSGINLFALSKTVSKVLLLMSDNVGQQRAQILIQVFFWASLKLGFLTLLGSLIWHSQSVPGMTLLLGLSTLVVVPIVGSYLWSRKDYA